MDETTNSTILEEAAEEGGFVAFFHGTIMSYLAFFTIIAGLLADLILIFVYFKYKRLQTRTDVFVTNWAFMNILTLFFSFVYFNEIIALIYPSLERNVLICTELHIYSTLDLCSFLFMFVLFLDRVRETTRLATVHICAVVYGVAVAILVVSLLFCGAHYDFVITIAILLVYAVLLICVITRDIKIFRGTYSGAIDEDATSRLNIVRIFTYGLLLMDLCDFLSAMLPGRTWMLAKIARASNHLTSGYIFAYLLWSNRNLRFYLVNLFRRNKYKPEVAGDEQGEDV